MSTAAKQRLLNNINTRLYDVVTAAQRDKIMALISEEMIAFDTEEIISAPAKVSLDLMEEFINAKTIEGKTGSTLSQYRYILNRFLSDVGTPVPQITVYHIRAYLMSERNRGVSDSSISGYRSVLCSFFGWLYKESLIPKDPMLNIGTIKTPKVVRLPYSDVEIERLKSACKTVRDKALICFMLATGCRVSEVCGVDRDAVSWSDMRCKVLGKGNKERIVYLDSVAIMYLKQYLSDRKDSSPALFVSRHGKRMTPAGIQVMLRRLGEKIGIENVHPHRFRRTLATNLINRGMPIQEVAHVLGHEKIDTTMTYIYIENQNVQAAYRRYS